MDLTVFYKLTEPAPIRWIWIVFLAIYALIAYLWMCHKEGIKMGTTIYMRFLYEMFIKGRVSFEGMDIMISGIILSFLAHPLMHWPTVGMVVYLIGTWILMLGFVKILIEIPIRFIKRRQENKI